MPRLTLKQVARVAENLGHRDLAVVPRGIRWAATCSCGYSSTGRQTQALAAQAAAHHLEVITRAWAASGASLPDTPKTEQAFESRPSSVA